MVRVAYFAAAKELAGCDVEDVPCTEALDVTQFKHLLGMRKPRLAPYLARMRLAVNGEFADADTRIREGDEVAVMPPVAGGSGTSDNDAQSSRPSLLAEVRTTPLSVDEVIQRVQAPHIGGIAVFLGTVRDHHAGKAVSRLDYEAYTALANRELSRILTGLAEGHPGTRLAALHRVGELAIGDTAVVVAAGAPHREEAFALCRTALDAIKHSVPIWKKEWSPDGSALWVNLESDERG